MLEERQIMRYARQILLREVGGRGQEKVLHRLVEVRGQSQAALVAVTYLAAGGSPLRAQGLTGAFLSGATLEDFNQDAAPGSHPLHAELVVAPLRPSGTVPCVLLGAGGLVSFPTAPDAAAIDLALTRLAAAPASSTPVLLGSLAAVAVQRLVLGFPGPPQTVLCGGTGLSSTAVL